MPRYRMRTPSTGREIIMQDPDPDEIYVDRDTGEPLEVVGMLLPLEGPSRLPWAVENLRFCNWCDELAPVDLNDCPTCGRRMAPIEGSAA